MLLQFKNTRSGIFQNLYNNKKIKKSCKEASNEKIQKIDYNYNFKILRMTFMKITKSEKLPKRHQKTKFEEKIKKNTMH